MQTTAMCKSAARRARFRLVAVASISALAVVVVSAATAWASCPDGAVQAAQDVVLVLTPDGWFVESDCVGEARSGTQRLPVSEDVQAMMERDANYEMQMTAEAASQERPAVLVSEDVQAMMERDANHKMQMAEEAARIASVAEETEIAPTTVVYGEVDGQQIVLDVYMPAVEGGALLPAVILIHGGAGKFGDRSVEADRARGLAANGYVAFSIDYRLLQDDGSNTWPAQLEDAQLAVRWVRANVAAYNVDPARICALGHSFGGLLAAQLGVRDTARDTGLTLGEFSSKVACVVSIAGGLDALHPSISELVAVENVLYGGATGQNFAVRRDASPLAHVDAQSAPFLIFHGADDEDTSVEESRAMVAALQRAGVAVVYVEYPHAPHFYWINFFEITGSWDTVSAYTLAFLQEHLRGEMAMR